MSNAVQLRGKDQVLNAYSNIDVKVWSIYQFKNLVTKGEGSDMLAAFLQMLSENATGAIYTLKTYEDISDPRQVKEKTEASGSLNFRLDENDFSAVGSSFYQQSHTAYGKLFQEVQELKKQVAEQQAPETLEQAAIGLLATPSELAQLLLAIKELFRPNSAQTPQLQQTYQPPAAVGNITPGAQQRELTELEKNKMANAIDVLIELDPNVADHFEMLAGIAKKNPAQFKLILLTLENMK